MEPRYRLLLLFLSTTLSFSYTTAQVIINCNFEDAGDPLCGFYNVDTDDADFKRSTGASSSVTDTSPLFDHTYGNDTGHFLDTDVTTFGLNSPTARVFSPSVAVAAGTSGLCLEFYYHMFGTSLESMHVYRKTRNVETSMYNVSGSVGDYWVYTKIDIAVDSSITSIQIIFEANISWGVRGDVAFDDITLSLAQCPAVGTRIPPQPTTPEVPLAFYYCNFDDPNHGQCTPKPNDRNDFDWIFRQSGVRPNDEAPVYDHTTSTSSGLYLYVPQVSSQSKDQELGELRTALLQPAFQPKCLEFYYYMRGNQVGTLNAYPVPDGQPPPVNMPWNRTGDQGGYWTRGLLDIYPTFSNYRVAFEANRVRDYDGCIAIDDLKLKDGRCPAEEVKCDFENLHICYFTQDRTDDMDWTVHNGATPSYGTGPKNDHTYGNITGNYMFIETSSPVNVGHVARLISPPITETHGHAHCLIFWYHMFGQHVDALNVLLANTSAPTQRKLVWTLSGNRGDKWRAAEVHLENDQDFLVIFEAFRGSSYQGDIALDDVWITSTVGCPGEAGLKNYSSITCDFEEIEVCYYMQDKTDDFNWTWQNGASQSLTNTGPVEDHTTNSQLGFYMYIQEDYLTWPGGTARLLSPEAKVQPRKSCLEFWYHMYGRDIESLSVYMKKSGATDLPDPMWSMSGDMGNYWHRAAVDVPVTDYKFRFVFEGVRGQAYRDNIAIDDVTFYEAEDCPQFTTNAPIPTTTPVPVSSANCDFEDVNNTMCGYTQSIYDEFDWSYGAANPISVDHTQGTANGHYLYIDSTAYYRRYNDRADIYSPLIMGNNQPQCLEFYYYMTGYSVDFLMVYLAGWRDTLAIDPLFSLYGDKGEKWNLARVDIAPMSYNFQVVFEALYSYWSQIGIDDIKFTMGACPKVVPTPNPMDGSCDFESGFKACGYEHQFYNFYWLEHSGATASKGTGPQVDHTTGTDKGMYMYVEASLPQRPENRARLISPVMYHRPGTPKCMVFYYHMNGPSVGKINVYWQTRTGSESLLSLTGNSKDRWHAAGVDLTNMGERFQIIFEGIVGYGVAGDMAIDDISLRLQPCPGFAKEASTSFEIPGDLEGFQQYYEADTYWLWHDEYITASSLPDELLAGDGSFMYLDGTFFKPDTWAVILSPLMAGHTHEHCLDYDYVIYKEGVLMVSVYQKGGVPYDLMIKDGVTAWTHDRRTLTKAEVGEDFMIYFVGKLGSSSTGYIAIDNLVIRENGCNELAKPGETGAQVSGGTVAMEALLGILLAVAFAVIAIGSMYFIQRRRAKGEIPAVLYKNETGDANDNGGSLARDLSISNPNYDSATLQSNA